jgi:iron complex outermembrane receptor protein
MAIAAFKNGIYSYYKQGKSNTLADVSLFYSKELTEVKSKFDLLVLHSYQDFYTDVYNYATYDQDGVVDPASVPTFKTDKPEYRLESYLGRLNYTFNSKYLLTASMRRDASSKFSPSTRVGYFPAAVLAWKMNEEFFKNSSTVSDLKLRLGWGITGQQDIGNYYPYIPKYSQSQSTAQYQFGSNFYNFLRPAAYDANIKWETTTTNNIGLDFGLFQGRISGNVDVYKKKTKDLLSTVPIAPGANFDISLTTNVGNMVNKGVEFTINTIPVQTTDFTWNLGFNVTYNESKITNLLKQTDASFKGIPVSSIQGATGNNIGKFAVDYAPYTFFVYKQIYDKQGAPIEGLFEDINRDGQINDADRYFYKKPAPDFMFGVNTSFTYKKWSMGMVGHAMIGNYLYNNFAANSSTLRALKNPLLYVQNVSADYLNAKFTNMQYLSDYYIENASFFRLDNINFGYNAGKIFKNRESQLRITASVQNVLVITNYSGLDPEYNPSDLTRVGVDNVIYPRPRIFSIGFNLDF